jgi:hypothetical protein
MVKPLFAAAAASRGRGVAAAIATSRAPEMSVEKEGMMIAGVHSPDRTNE